MNWNGKREEKRINRALLVIHKEEKGGNRKKVSARGGIAGTFSAERGGALKAEVFSCVAVGL